MANVTDKSAYIHRVLDKYSDMVFKLALSQTRSKADAEDIFQEVYIRLITYQPDFQNEEHEKAWLIRVTLNCCRNLFSSAWYRHAVPLTEDIVFQDKKNEEVWLAVLTLPVKYRKVIHLFYYENLSVSQISNVLETNEGTIKSQLSRARKMLKAKLGGGLEYEE